MLCSSAESAAFAGQAGIGMVFAEFIARADGDAAVAAYRQAFQPSAFRSEPWAALALIAFAADDADEAWRLDAPRRAASVAMLEGARRRFGDVAEAIAYLADRSASPALQMIEARTLAADQMTVLGRLAEKTRTSQADELFVMATGPSLEARIHSLELLQPD
jgi:alkanesulfonate monooxygenase SsuD/methylene tetrahydromethanopterin reductase-like flavin-dependent oxidoreductase (luciferase family)